MKGDDGSKSIRSTEKGIGGAVEAESGKLVAVTTVSSPSTHLA
jgi:hypothetical protein